ncbi:unnamed protein product [Mytilus coruscus]|uniref:Uncharacterized protein n=1 Tax=Mytilus coruscus TaxID=42192 RepID=A0A6J8BVK9_MYTCO|nr:unnamed protein product [Mytilus coruscus]
MSSRQQPTQPTVKRSTPTTVIRSNKPVDKRATGLLHQSEKGILVNNNLIRPPTGPINHPVPGQQDSQLVKQNYNIPSHTAGRPNFNRVIGNQQHQPPISQTVPIPIISSQPPPTRPLFNRPGQLQTNTNQIGFQQPLNNTIGQQRQPPQAIQCQQEFYRQQPVQHLHNVAAPVPQPPHGNIPYQQGRPHQPTATQNLVQGTAQSCYYGAATHLPVYPQQQQLDILPRLQPQNYNPHKQINRGITSITTNHNQIQRLSFRIKLIQLGFPNYSIGDSDSSSSTSGVVYRRSRHKSRNHRTHSRHSVSNRHVSPVEPNKQSLRCTRGV